MTTIVGIVKNDVVILGADSQVTDGDRINNDLRMEKITKNNGYLLAGAGDATPCDILQHIFIPPIPTAIERKNLYKFMITKFVPSMRECLEENGWKPVQGDDSGFSMLIAFDGELFDIGDDFSVLLNNQGIYGVGNGSKYAIGALYAGASVEKALEIASQNDIYTSGPFQIVQQKKNDRTKK
jgi:ATP-dependent protease HslVU (ClpYQ) peptidase subunit